MQYYKKRGIIFDGEERMFLKPIIGFLLLLSDKNFAKE